jgi:hypothetical protein
MASEWTQWYPHEIDAWQGSAMIQTLSDAAYRAFHNLIMVQFQQPNGKLIDDAALLAKQSRMGARWNASRDGMPTISEEVRECFVADGNGFIYNPKQLSKWERAHGKHLVYVDRLEAARKTKAAQHAARADSIDIAINRAIHSTIDSSIHRPIDRTIDISINSSIPRAERERERERNIKASCAEVSSAPPFTTLPLVSGEEFSISFEQFAAWEKAFPGIDVENQIIRMRVWLHANPKRGKTRRGISSFAVTWLSRAQDNQGSGGGNVSGNRSQQRTNGNIEAARSAAATIGAEILDWPGGSKASSRERRDVEAVLGPTQ